MWLKSPRVQPSAEAEHEGNGTVLANYLQNNEVIWLKVKMALYSKAGTFFENTGFPGILEGQGIYICVCIIIIYIQCSWHNLSSNSLPRANQSSSERSECLRELHPWHPLAICTTQSSNLGQSITLVSIMRSFQWAPKQAGNCQQLRGCTLRPTKLRGRSAVNEHPP